MDPLTIAGIVASLASAAVQQQAAASAAKRQREQAVMAQKRQLDMQNEASAAAARRASEYDPTERGNRQQQIQQEITGEMERQVQGPQVTAQGVQVGATIDGGGADYLTAKAKEEAKTKASLHALASLMGRMGSAGELRRREAVGFGDTAGEIGRIQTGANNLWGADQVGIEAAGQVSPGAMLASQALGAAGSYAMSQGAMPKGYGRSAGGVAGYPEYGMASGRTGAWV